MVQFPSVDELLSICTKLLHKESLAFPVHDLLVMICSHDEGRYRSNVVTFLIDRIKECGLVSSHGNGTMLAALFHVLALILNEDVVAREAASKSSFIKIASDILYQWDSTLSQGEKGQVPKWVRVAFLALDRLLQVDERLNSEIAEQLKKEVVNSTQTSLTIDDDKQHNLQSALGLSSNCSNYQKWMKTFGSAQHIMAGHEKKNIEVPTLKARARMQPLPFLLSSLLPSRPQLKLPEEKFSDEDNLDGDLDEPSDSGNETDPDDFPPFKPLTKAQLRNLSRAQKKAYLDEFEYRKKNSLCEETIEV
ncbi:hypothetical protein KIW84_070130 [Lathyrus oleraceus]|uniref:Uncharacterized protein n=1 Tax=Pisum sativum TaxID=3888 RepID=A0A9D4VFF0_PEA|nr:hypothetical protein KIW84_070130 [Pisum sativum]